MKITSNKQNFQTFSKEKLSFTRNNRLEKILDSLREDPSLEPSDLSNLYLFENNIFDRAVQDTKKLTIRDNSENYKLEQQKLQSIQGHKLKAKRALFMSINRSIEKEFNTPYQAIKNNMRMKKISFDKKRQSECKKRMSFVFQKSCERETSSCDVILCCPEKGSSTYRYKSDKGLKQVYKPSNSQLKETKIKKLSERENVGNFCLKNSITSKALPKIDQTPNISTKNKTLSVLPKVNILHNNEKKYFKISQIK